MCSDSQLVSSGELYVGYRVWLCVCGYSMEAINVHMVNIILCSFYHPSRLLFDFDISSHWRSRILNTCIALSVTHVMHRLHQFQFKTSLSKPIHNICLPPPVCGYPLPDQGDLYKRPCPYQLRWSGKNIVSGQKPSGAFWLTRDRSIYVDNWTLGTWLGMNVFFSSSH